MNELILLVKRDPEAGYLARALGDSIFTQADDYEALRERVKDAVECHFSDAALRPRIIHLHSASDNYSANRNE